MAAVIPGEGRCRIQEAKEGRQQKAENRAGTHFPAFKRMEAKTKAGLS
jgi:hypothetical protein